MKGSQPEVARGCRPQRQLEQSSAAELPRNSPVFPLKPESKQNWWLCLQLEQTSDLMAMGVSLFINLHTQTKSINFQGNKYRNKTGFLKKSTNSYSREKSHLDSFVVSFVQLPNPIYAHYQKLLALVI